MSGIPAAAPPAAMSALSARALASRINGARSRGPKTTEGKARSSQNALKHGLRAQKFVVLPDEDATEFEAQEAALLAELAPEGALQTLLARRIAAAAWRLSRADRIEAELFAQQGTGDGDLGLALIPDCNGARAFPTLLRYRGAAEAELWRALKALKALQAETAALAAAGLAPSPMVGSGRGRLPVAPTCDEGSGCVGARGNPKEPKARANPCKSAKYRPRTNPAAGEGPGGQARSRTRAARGRPVPRRDRHPPRGRAQERFGSRRASPGPVSLGRRRPSWRQAAAGALSGRSGRLRGARRR
jgi:hypothetical protein